MRQVSLTQGTPEWLQWRASKFGASDAPAMLGVSSYKKRSQLLDEKATGITPEVDAATQRRFDEGHRIEALARPLAEKIVGEDLYPVSGELEGANLTASFDGLTLMEDVAWECKSSNQRLRDAMPHEVCDASYGAQLPEEYRVQMAHQQIVSGAERTLFTAASFDADGTPVDVRHCWYEAEPELQKRVLDGWEQFAKDLENHTPEPKAAPVVATPQEALPAVSVQVGGALQITDNLDVFGQALRHFVDNIPQQPQTDQQFADCEAACKTLKKAEDALKTAEDNALAQISDVNAMRQTVATLHDLARTTRLATEKLVKAEKENRKRAIVAEAIDQVQDHEAGINQALGEYRTPALPSLQQVFAAAIKGRSSLDSIQAQCDQEVANLKIQMNAIADRVRQCIKVLEDGAGDMLHLFPDRQRLCAEKQPDDLRNLVQARVLEHKQAEAKRLEAERARIRAEEERRAQAAAEAELKTKVQQAIDSASAGVEYGVAQDRLDPQAAAPTAPTVEQDAALVKDILENGVEIPFGTAQDRLAPGEPAGSNRPTLNLSAINARLAPLSISGAGLAEFGIEPLATDKNAKLYSEAQFEALLRKLVHRLAKQVDHIMTRKKEAAEQLEAA